MRLFIAAAAAAALLGCQTAPEDVKAEAARVTAAPSAAQPARRPEAPGSHESCGGEKAGAHESCGGEKAGAHESCGGEKAGAHESCGACGGESAAQAVDAPVTRVDPATGATVTVVGAKVGGAPVVKVADLLAKPKEFAGKSVRLEGNVTAMCGHRRAWFAVASEDRTGNAVRVFTAPAFLVPAGSVGKRARAEGTIEVAEANGVVRVTVRAAGAEFM